MKTTLIAAALVLAAGCSKSKQDKCESGWNEMMKLAKEMSKAFGEEGGKMETPTAEDKKEFMDMCMKLPDDAVECMTSLEKAFTDPKCMEVMGKMEKEEKKANAAKIEWEDQTLLDGKVSVKIPKGWKKGEFFGYEPPDDVDLGFFTKFDVESTCGGFCEPQPAAEWKKRFDDDIKMQTEGGQNAKVVKDEAVGANGRIVVIKSDIGHEIRYGVWNEGAESYIVCKATIDEDIEDKLGDFEKACREMKVTWPAAAAAEAPAVDAAP